MGIAKQRKGKMIIKAKGVDCCFPLVRIYEGAFGLLLESKGGYNKIIGFKSVPNSRVVGHYGVYFLPDRLVRDCVKINTNNDWAEKQARKFLKKGLRFIVHEFQGKKKIGIELYGFEMRTRSKFLDLDNWPKTFPAYNSYYTINCRSWIKANVRDLSKCTPHLNYKERRHLVNLYFAEGENRGIAITMLKNV